MHPYVAAALLSAMKSILEAVQLNSWLHTVLQLEFLDCPLLSCFALFSWGRSDHTLLCSSSVHSSALQIVSVA